MPKFSKKTGGGSVHPKGVKTRVGKAATKYANSVHPKSRRGGSRRSS